MSKFSKGSEWRKWDLHVHTPASFHWNDGKKFGEMTPEEKSVSLKTIVDKMNSVDVAAFSIMDYFTFDGIIELRNFLRQPQAIKLEKTLFPGIEIRIDAPVDYRLNIHAIFCESVTDQELRDFKSSLIISGLNRALSDEAIIAAARTLPADKAREYIGAQDYQNDDAFAFELGMKTIKITRESFSKATKALTSEKCLVILPYDTSDGILKLNWKDHPHDDCFFLKQADIFEARNKDNIDLFLNVLTERNRDYIEHFIQNIGGLPKPVVSGSDAHKISNYGAFPNGKATWIKADPTFRGLRKTLVEPHSRTFIGDRPEKLRAVSSKSTKFVSRIDVRKKTDAKLDEVWFNNDIGFNPELVAIIGNKGSGKSALADILGLLGNSRQESSFSFLNDKKFRERQGHKAEKFQATIQWVSGDSSTTTLSGTTDSSSVENIRYIPQSYLEKLCNEISTEASLFDQELKAVIFSHISEDQRLGHGTLDDLIKYKTEETNREIALLRGDLRTALSEIIEGEEKLTDQYKQGLVNQLTSKQAELTAHNKAKPGEVEKPTVEANGSGNELIKRLSDAQIAESEINQKISQKKSELENLRKKKASIEKALNQIEIIDRQFKQAIPQLDTYLKEVGLKSSDVLSLEVKRQPVDVLNEEVASQIEDATNSLSLDNQGSLLASLEKAQSTIRELSTQIDEPNRKYQAYLEEIEEWTKVQQLIQGDAGKPGTIAYLNTLISEISNVPTKLIDLERKRDDLVSQIYSKIMGLAETYRQFYAPVQAFVGSNPFGDDAFRMAFDVSIVDRGFGQRFFQLINRNRSGTFYGIEESEKTLAKMLIRHNFNRPDEISVFTREILGCLKFDCRDEKRPPVSVASQLKEGKTIDLYYSIFGLEYLEPRYSLKLNEKNLEQLSPGERGTLLLIFYLMVDKDDRPLVVDQPEENLDNQTIFKVLVPCIKSAKRNRQLFLVTHNPNLAVVCDAEQVVVATIDKANKNTVSYRTGAIESPEINKLIIDILEGTRPAFDNRDFKYFSE